MNIPLAPLGVTPRFVTWRGHQIALHEAGSGPTVLLVHSINAAASCYEMRAPFRLLAAHYRVVGEEMFASLHCGRLGGDILGPSVLSRIWSGWKRLQGTGC